MHDVSFQLTDYWPYYWSSWSSADDPINEAVNVDLDSGDWDYVGQDYQFRVRAIRAFLLYKGKFYDFFNAKLKLNSSN